MTAKELRQQAQKIVNVFAGQPPDFTSMGISRNEAAAAQGCARHVLDTTHEDDGEAVTLEWLLSIGFEKPADQPPEHPGVPWLYWIGSRLMLDNPNKGWQETNLATRGAVRALLRVLGV